ncbi:MAG: COX15/CtaA family protein [Vicinamibacterales bacterium]
MTKLHRFTWFVAACTVILLAAGGMVTSTRSGLAVPDWPNTYGHFMFSFPFEKMVGGILYEHGHRMIASLVGMLTIVLTIWTWRVDQRRWVRWLAVGALAAVVLQGLLGGLTVLLRLPAPVSVGHAALAQLFFCITVSLALFTSRGWLAPSSPLPDDTTLRVIAPVTTVLIYAQMLLGATMRHREAGLAIPDFPWAYGRLVPPFWSADIAIHYAHRVGALVVTAMVVAVAAHVYWWHRRQPPLKRPAVLMVGLVLIQVTLGAFVVLTGLQPIVNTAHLVNGALLLAASVVLALRSYWISMAARADLRAAQGRRAHMPPLEAHP